MKTVLAMLLVLLQPLACSAMDSFIFKLVPDEEQLSANAGSTVGWGYSLQNESRRYWLVTKTLKPDPFRHGSGKLLFDFPALAPGGQVNVPYDLLNQVGLYQFTWDATAPPGFANHGEFHLQAEWWTADPTQGGSFVMHAFDTSRKYFTLLQP